MCVLLISFRKRKEEENDASLFVSFKKEKEREREKRKSRKRDSSFVFSSVVIATSIKARHSFTKTLSDGIFFPVCNLSQT